MCKPSQSVSQSVTLKSLFLFLLFILDFFDFDWGKKEIWREVIFCLEYNYTAAVYLVDRKNEIVRYSSDIKKRTKLINRIWTIYMVPSTHIPILYHYSLPFSSLPLPSAQKRKKVYNTISLT